MTKRFLAIVACCLFCVTLFAQDPYEGSGKNSGALYEPEKIVYNSTFSFALLTDLHIDVNNSLNSEDLAAIIDDINMQKGLAFVLVTGDVTEHGDRASLEHAKKLLEKLKLPYYVIPGNHDTRSTESGGTDFKRIFGAERFRLLMNDYIFLGINTGQIQNSGDGYIQPQDIEWLTRQLKIAGKKRPIFLVSHHPLKNGDVSNWYEVTDVARKYNIQGVLSGHYHRNFMDNFDALPAVINRTMQRGKEQKGNYTIYAISDSLYIMDKAPQEEAIKWGSLSLQPKVYVEQDSKLKPSYAVNSRFRQVKRDWDVNTKKAILAAPAVNEDMVVYADNEGVIHAISTVKGKSIWKYNIGSKIASAPVIADGKVIVGGTDNNIYSINQEHGTLAWKLSTNRPVVATPSVDNGVVYIGSSDGFFRAIGLNDGLEKWQYQGVSGYVETAPIVTERQVLFLSSNNILYALNKNDGSLIWQKEGITTVPQLLVGERIASVTPSQEIVVIDLRSGNTLFNYSDYRISGSLGTDSAKHILYARTTNDSIVALNLVARVPARVFEAQTGIGMDRNKTELVAHDNWVLISTKNGELIALDKQTGNTLWRYKLSNSLLHKVTPIGQTGFILTTVDGRISKITIK